MTKGRMAIAHKPSRNGWKKSRLDEYESTRPIPECGAEQKAQALRTVERYCGPNSEVAAMLNLVSA